MCKKLLGKVTADQGFFRAAVTGGSEVEDSFGLSRRKLALEVFRLSFLRPDRVEAGIRRDPPEPTWQRKFVFAAKLRQLDERLRESYLDDLLYLFGALEISSGGSGYMAFVTVEDLLECGLVTGEHELYQLGIGSHGAHGSADDGIVWGVAQNVTLESFPYAAHSSLRSDSGVRMPRRPGADHGYTNIRESR